MADIPKSTRYFQPGVVAIVYLPTIAATTMIPTSAEVTAGTNLTREVDDIAGWTKSTTFLETKDAASRVRPKIAGAVSLEDSSITFNGSKNGIDARTIFAPDQEGYILIADAGLGAGKKADIFPIAVGTVAKVRNLDNANFKIRVDFGITNVPVEDITLP